MRHPGESLDEIWDYFSSSGRVKGLEEENGETFKDLREHSSGAAYVAEKRKQTLNDHRNYTSVRRKMTAIYFLLSLNNPYSAQKICINPANFVRNEEIVAKRLNAWF